MGSYKHLSTSYQLLIITEVKLQKIIECMFNILPLRSTLQPSITVFCTHNVCQQQLLKLKHYQS